jgi:hypothetical protein
LNFYMGIVILDVKDRYRLLYGRNEF